MGDEDYWADILVDAWRFFRLWVDIEADLYPEQIHPVQLIQMLERLPLLDGVLTARAQAEADKTGAGRRSGTSRYTDDQVEVVGSSGAELTSHAAFAGLIDYKKV